MSAFRRISTTAGAGLTAAILCAGAALAGPTPTATDLAAFVPRSGDLPGYTPSGPIETVRTIGADVAPDATSYRAADVAHLRADGFVAATYRLQVSTADPALTGDGGVTELSSPGHAIDYDRWNLGLFDKPGPYGTASRARFLHFSVPGVPGARGAAQVARTPGPTGSNSGAQVLWVEGDCAVIVGVDSRSDTAPERAVQHAAQAIYKRTTGDCTS